MRSITAFIEMAEIFFSHLITGVVDKELDTHKIAEIFGALCLAGTSWTTKTHDSNVAGYDAAVDSPSKRSMGKQLLETKQMVSIVYEVLNSTSRESSSLIRFNLDFLSVENPSGRIFPKIQAFLGHISKVIKPLSKLSECN